MPGRRVPAVARRTPSGQGFGLIGIAASILVEHDPFGKPVSTFPDRA
jgi:hypothetical protein